MGYFWTVDDFVSECALCNQKFSTDVQFKSGAQRYMCYAKVGESIDVLDGSYQGIADSDRCASCEKSTGISYEYDVEVKVKDRIVNINKYSTEKTINKRDRILIKSEDILSPPNPLKPAGIEDMLLFDARWIGESPNYTAAVISPYPFASFEFIKQALLYYDKLILLDDSSDFIDGYDWPKWSERLWHNQGAHSYIWQHFRKRPKYSRKIIQEYLRKPSSFDYAQQREIESALSVFKERFENFFHGNLEDLILNSHILIHDPPRIQQQFLCEWLDKFYKGDNNAKDLSLLSNYTYGNCLNSPFPSDSHSVLDEVRNQLARLDTKVDPPLRNESIRRAVDKFAINEISLSLPKLETKSFEDVIVAKELLKDELLSFRSKMEEIGIEIDSEWDWKRMKEDDLETQIRSKFDESIKDIFKKTKEIRKKFARDIGFSAGSLATNLGITYYMGIPLEVRIVLASAGMTYNAAKAIIETISDRSELAKTSHTSYLWKVKETL